MKKENLSVEDRKIMLKWQKNLQKKDSHTDNTQSSPASSQASREHSVMNF